MNRSYSTLDDVRELIACLDNETANDPARALEVATAKLPAVEPVGACARAEVLMSRGTAYRTLGELAAAELDFCRSYRACRCAGCYPRLLRRWAPLWTQKGGHEAAILFADTAVSLFCYTGDTEMTMRARATRGVVLFWSGDLVGALMDARAAYAYFRSRARSAPLHFCCAIQQLAVYLMASGGRKSWQEALEVLAEAEFRLNKVHGLRILKLKLRWVHALVEVELGTVDADNARDRIVRVLQELLGLRLPIEASQISAERAQRNKSRTLYDVAALTTDAALLGGTDEIITWGARQALALLTGSEDDEMKQELAKLCDVKTGDDVREIALNLRARCPGAPPFPPRLLKAA